MPTYSRFMECIHVEGRLGLLEVKRRQSSAVKRIVARCVDSCEDLDLGDCGLTQLPEDIFLLLRPRKLIRFAAAHNFLGSLPSNVSAFSQLSSLAVSCNQLSTLPRELAACTHLASVDISTNNFVEIPSVLLEMESITHINAKSNFIAEVNDDDLENSGSLEEVNLEDNPLTNACHDSLQSVVKIRILISDKKMEDWEDLSI